MKPTDTKLSSSTTLEMLGGLWLRDTLVRIEHKLDKLLMTVQEAIDTLAAENVKLDDISAKLTEGFAEITALIGQLQNTNLTPEQEALVNSIKGKVDAVQPQAQQIADIVPGP